MGIGDNIKKIRKGKGIPQKKLAEMLDNMPVSTLANYENNHREPNLDILNKISKTLGVSLSELIGEKTFKYKISKNIYENMDDDEVVKLLDLDKNFFESLPPDGKEAFLAKLAYVEPYKLKLKNLTDNIDTITKEDIVLFCHDIQKYYFSVIENLVSDNYDPLHNEYTKLLKLLEIYSERIKLQNQIIKKYQDICDKIVSENKKSNFNNT